MKIRFVPSDPKYAALFLAYRNDPVTRQFNPLVNQSIFQLKHRLTMACSDWEMFEESDSFFWFVAIDQKGGGDDEIVGTASLQDINRTMLTAEIGYGVFTDYRGNGIGRQILRHLTEEAFKHTRLRKLIAFVHEQNLASRHLLEKIGYTQEGILRQHFLINGAPANEVVYGILREEFA